MAAASSLVIFLAGFFVHNEASRILAVFPTPSISHQVVFRPLVLELVKRGHEVVMMTTDPIYKKGESPTNLTEIDLHDLSYQIWRDGFLAATVTSGKKGDLKEQSVVMFTLMEKIFEHQMLSDEMQTILNDKTQKFDLLLIEAFYPPAIGLTSIFKVPVILVTSFGALTDTLKMVGTPIHPFAFPTISQQRINNLTVWEKISELFNHVFYEFLFEIFERNGNKMLKRVFGEDIPSVSEMKNNVDMLFVNVHPIWDVNRPVAPNVIYMGGLHQKPPKELPQDLQAYLDSSKHGVIYISFGTNVQPELLPAEKIQALINVFSKLPYDVLWKWNNDELPGRTENIRISKWLPQSDLLRHPKVKLFITQGGLQSTDEAITAGVPLIGFPMLGDQWMNVELYVKHKIGVRIDIDTFTEEQLTTAIHTVINDKSYRENIVRLRSIMQDQPQTPLERATWWTEYVLRHGGAKHLRSPAANMPLTQYIELELICYLLLGFISVIAVLGYLAYFLYGLCFANQRVKSKIKSH